jgi:hypothetical protein
MQEFSARADSGCFLMFFLMPDVVQLVDLHQNTFAGSVVKRSARAGITMALSPRLHQGRFRFRRWFVLDPLQLQSRHELRGVALEWSRVGGQRGLHVSS